MVILGAGLDARAFRLPWPTTTHVLEVDTPEMIAFKEHVVSAEGTQPTCLREVVPIDLREDWPSALLEHGFDASQPSAWLLEGILMYLEEADRNGLLTRVSDLSAAGSHLAMEPPGWTIPPELAEQVARGVLDREAIARSLALRQAAGAEPSVAEPGTWLQGFGWQPYVYDVAERFVAYGRATPSAVVGSRRWLVSATR